jgi:RNA polymerase sigma-70 factor, ECF subfamily
MANPMEQKVREALGRSQTRDRMIHTARRVVGEHDSEDVAHDAVVLALAAAERFRAQAEVGTWLHRIAVNAALMSHRTSTRSTRRLSRARHQAVDAPWLGHEVFTVTAAAALEEDEARRILRQAVAQLPATYREVVERCVYREQDPGHVSHHLGISPSAVRTRFSRAQDRLRKLLATTARS